jgi:hypothetical protein
MNNTLRVGAAFPDPPFNGAGADGGVDISLMERIAAALGMAVEFISYTDPDFNGTFQELEAKVIRCVRLWSDGEGRSQVETGSLPLNRPGEAGQSKLSELILAEHVSFEETPPTSSLAWHIAPYRQFVITVVGVLEFITSGGERFRLDPQTILFAEDTSGSGHRWSIVGGDAWQRAYVQLRPDGVVPFIPDAG